MSTYRLKIKCNNAQMEVVAKNGALLAYEMDRYLENFVNRKIESAPYAAPKKAYTQEMAQLQTILQGFDQEQQTPRFSQPMQSEPAAVQIEYTQPNFVQETPVAQEQPVNKQVQNSQQEIYINLGDFLAANKSGNIFSDFIISAYYIKRVLNINFFTIKMLNSKFYPATGSLVVLSIIDEARTRGFIETKEEDGTHKYTLSAAGESYFINQLRG